MSVSQGSSAAIGAPSDAAAVGDGSVIGILKANRASLAVIAAAAIITGGVITAGRLDTAPAKATAAAPTYTEGTSVALSTDLAGALRTAGGGGGGNPTAGRLDSIRRLDSLRFQGVLDTLRYLRAGRLDSMRRLDTLAFVRAGRLDSIRRLDTLRNLAAWLGSAAPTVGQKAMASSLPMVLASDQSTLNVTCVSGCAGAVEAQTYTAAVFSSAAAASKDHLNLFNAAGSGKVLRIRLISTAPQLAAAVTGLVQSFLVRQTSTVGATCTAITIRLSDNTNAAVPAQVTSSTNCTTDPTSSFDWLVCSINGEETSPMASTHGNCYRHPANGGQPFTLREGQGISVSSGALSGAWPVHVRIEFTM